MKGLGTTVLNSVFVHVQYHLTIFWSPHANALPHFAIKVLKYGVIHGRSDDEILTVHVGTVSSIALLIRS